MDMFFETSAKLDIEIDTMFRLSAAQIIKSNIEEESRDFTL